MSESFERTSREVEQPIELLPEVQAILDEHKYVGEALKKIEDYDQVTYKHSLRVANLISQISQEIGLKLKESALLIEAALVHDIGKIKVDKEILSKKGRLDDDEWEIMGQHGRFSFDYIKEHGGSLEVAKIAVAHHDHGRSRSISRKGDRRIENRPFSHPERRKVIRRQEQKDERQIKLLELSRILSIVDVFEALRSKRQYKEGFSLDKCEEILIETFPGDGDRVIIDQLLELYKNDNES
ncbi:MAG: HD domain-containing protein [Candidatus Magasanikbacteria bacterium]|nr:HD domain-containing protein [Candidatus Magasanikbacteria bacterium]MBT4071264.1 HD domain-containing protein [Candidatus Magasanikbacteria bacterium]